MSKMIPVFVTLAVPILFLVLIFYLLVRAIRTPGTRWWGIVILLAILTCYCTTMVGIAGMIVGSNATGSAALERHYCEQFCEALKQTETLPEAIACMDAAAATDEYQIHEPDKNLRFRYVWLLGGCFLFAGANLMMFGPGRREKRHTGDCIMMILAALVVFLTGIWQIAWGNGYAFQASAFHRFLTGWHETIRLDEIRASNEEIAAWLSGDGRVKGIDELFMRIRLLSVEPEHLTREKTEKQDDADASAPADAGTGPGVAIIGGADGPTAVFISSELMKQQAGGTGNEPAGNAPESGTSE
ncbi:MAG: hypothetical protein J6Y92_06885 [Lentisphaeria bacterium]|nr:hypothetical protein [Lentisphaeria bacterium]